MQKETSAKRRQLRFATIEKYLSSALTQKQFYLQKQLAYATFQFLLKKYRQLKAETKSGLLASNQFERLTFGPPMVNSELSGLGTKLSLATKKAEFNLMSSAFYLRD